MPYQPETKPFKCSECGVKTANLGKKCTKCLDPLRAVRFAKVKIAATDMKEYKGSTVYYDKPIRNKDNRRVIKVAKLPGSDIMES